MLHSTHPDQVHDDGDAQKRAGDGQAVLGQRGDAISRHYAHSSINSRVRRGVLVLHPDLEGVVVELVDPAAAGRVDF